MAQYGEATRRVGSVAWSKFISALHVYATMSGINTGIELYRRGEYEKGARSCKRHKCAYCNSAVIGYRGGFHNRHCKKHSCLMCLNGTTSATAQVCQNHACRHPRCFGRCRRGITGDVRGRADRDGRCANCWSRPHLDGNPYCQPCHEDYLRRREAKDRQWEAEERRLEAALFKFDLTDLVL